MTSFKQGYNTKIRFLLSVEGVVSSPNDWLVEGEFSAVFCVVAVNAILLVV